MFFFGGGGGGVILHLGKYSNCSTLFIVQGCSENIIFISSVHMTHEMSSYMKVRVSHSGDNEEKAKASFLIYQVKNFFLENSIAGSWWTQDWWGVAGWSCQQASGKCDLLENISHAVKLKQMSRGRNWCLTHRKESGQKWLHSGSLVWTLSVQDGKVSNRCIVKSKKLFHWHSLLYNICFY